MQQFSITNKEWLTPQQLESEFGISVSAQSRMRMRKNLGKAESLVFSKIGKRILYSRAEINKWLLRNRKGVE